MLNFKNPTIYSTKEVVTVLRAISQFLLKDPTIFQAEGVFRISGTMENSQYIIDSILQNKNFIHRMYSVHDYLGAIKLAVINRIITPIESEAMISMNEEVLASSEQVRKDIASVFIKKMVNSGDENKFHMGEILYLLFHLAKHALLFQNKNKMTSKNLGVVMGPYFVNSLETDPMKVLKLMQSFTETSQIMLEDNSYLTPFDETFRAECIYMMKKKIEMLENEEISLIRLREEKAAKIIALKRGIADRKLELADIKRNIINDGIDEEEIFKSDIIRMQQMILLLKQEDKCTDLPKLNQIRLEITSFKEKLSKKQGNKELFYMNKKHSTLISPSLLAKFSEEMDTDKNAKLNKTKKYMN